MLTLLIPLVATLTFGLLCAWAIRKSNQITSSYRSPEAQRRIENWCWPRRED